MRSRVRDDPNPFQKVLSELGWPRICMATFWDVETEAKRLHFECPRWSTFSEGENMMDNMVFGYARVSTREQNLDRQVIRLREHGIAERNIIVDKESGKSLGLV